MFSVIGCGFKIDNSLSFETSSVNMSGRYRDGFPIPLVPADNPMADNKVELGRQLFYDSRLSGDGSVSCAFCHQPSLAFTDGRSRAVGIQGNIHPPLGHVPGQRGLQCHLWVATTPVLRVSKTRCSIPLYNTQPPEMGAAGREAEILSRLKKDRDLRLLFHRAFPDDKYPVTMRNVIFALASFERTLISGNSPYDRWAYGADPDALNKDQRAGGQVVFLKKIELFSLSCRIQLFGAG